jgi:hypothetical protein
LGKFPQPHQKPATRAVQRLVMTSRCTVELRGNNEEPMIMTTLAGLALATLPPPVPGACPPDRIEHITFIHADGSEDVDEIPMGLIFVADNGFGTYQWMPRAQLSYYGTTTCGSLLVVIDLETGEPITSDILGWVQLSPGDQSGLYVDLTVDTGGD